MDDKKQGRKNIAPEGTQDKNASDEGKLTNQAGQSWDSEKLDAVNDEFAENVDLRDEIKRESGEKKGERRK